jgi:hypothetical protein
MGGLKILQGSLIGLQSELISLEARIVEAFAHKYKGELIFYGREKP